MGHAVAEGAKAGGDALNEVARLGEDVAIGMAARAGTIGQALRGLGPIGLGAAAAIGALWLAFDDTRKSEDDLTAINQALARTGASATMTAHDVQALAESLVSSTLQSRDEIIKAETELMQFGGVLGDSFERTLQLAADLSAAFGGNLSSNVKMLGAALNEPEQALDALEKAGVRFTDAQRDLIQGLVDSGRQFEAQQAILNAVAGRTQLRQPDPAHRRRPREDILGARDRRADRHRPFRQRPERRWWRQRRRWAVRGTLLRRLVFRAVP